jgi:CDP-diacylglycerol--glycerol-3-phosphate 3-phosphatidyltransferase
MERTSSAEQRPTAASCAAGDAGWWTIPNLLSLFRLLGSPLMIVLAWADLPAWCLAWFALLLFSDWIDGKLAKLLGQETAMGASLDTVADVTFYGCLLLAMFWLRWETIVQEMVWVSLAVSSYAASLAAALVRFHRMPSYHTRLAKTSWLLICLAVVSLMARWSAWPLRIAMAGVLLTNLEAVAITFLLPGWRVNVSSAYRALRLRQDESGGDSGDPP